MKQFIFNNKPYSQTDRKSLIENYLALGCLEVPILYNENFIDPIWNGTTFIEGATPEEIAESNKPIIPDTISVIPFFVQLELMGITEQDIVDKIIELHQLEILSNEQKIEALISVKRATKFERSHHFIGIVAQAFTISEAQVDQIFINGNL